MKQRPGSKHVLFATIGSLGDLHPCLALGQELQQRGYRVTIAAAQFYKSRVEALGIGFRSLRPNWNPSDPELIRQCEDLKHGFEVLFRELILPELRGTYEDLLSAAADADLMIAGEMVYAVPLVAEKLKMRWVTAILSPCSFLSAYDPSLLVNAPALYRLRTAGRHINRAALNLGRLSIQHWWNPVRQLRRAIGLRVDCDPLFRDKFSPDLVLALFSSCLAQPQPDWPAHTVQPGFVYYDRPSVEAVDCSELTAFLAAGDAPIVFTLGSTAVHNPGNFYEVSVAAARRLGRRAVLLGASAAVSASDILALPYAPYSEIFPHAAVIVHQGGSGTTAQALRAARPMLIVPYGWDQPDNGARVARLGAGLCISKYDYSAGKGIPALARLLQEPHFAISAADVGKHLQAEDGLTSACDAIEMLLQDR